ncbi:MAG: hypothetical protein WAK11_04610 [Candidatus Cybelea sp.]|jgi:hypothetical protein
MQGLKVHLGSLVLIFALLFVAFGAGTAFGAQMYMENARTNLQSALSNLQNAQANKGGYRANAINYVKEALHQVNLGIEYAQ